jgi:DNA-binding NarL/FixJ family response regulator
MLMLSGLGGKAYFNSYMAEIHYRQMASFITTGQHWYLPELLSLALRIAKNSVNGSSSDEWNRLTPREKEIAQAVSSGLNNKEIARMCDITERTVKAHLSHVFEKMGVKDRVSLVIRITSKNPFTHSA